jgi:hypothetical protein
MDYMALPDNFEVLRRQYPLPALAPVPPDWKGGFKSALFGVAQPWGDYAQARALIAHDRIAEARALLDRIMAHEGVAHQPQVAVLAALESMRTPDGYRHPQSFWAQFRDAEGQSLIALKRFTIRDYQKLQQYLLQVEKLSPQNIEAANVVLLAYIGASDLAMQVMLSVYAGGREPRSVIVVESIKAVALLLERRPAEAWDIFHKGVRNPASIVESYQGAKVPVPHTADKSLIMDFKAYCEIGLGLVMFDTGLDVPRRAYFKDLAPQLQGGVAAACRLLA